MRRFARLAVAWIVFGAGVQPTVPPSWGQGPPVGRGAAADLSVPRDLRPLLTPRRSEMAIVATRYSADRALLITNYAGGGRPAAAGGLAGADGAAAVAEGAARRRRPGDTVTLPPVTISTERIARLKRFDTSWLAAVRAIDASRLSPQARLGRDSLLTAIQRNLAALDAEASDLAQVLPLVPFLGPLVNIVEARIKVQPFDARTDASTVNEATKQVRAIRAQLMSGLSGSGGVRASRQQALAAASAVQTLRGGLDYWFSFYDGYDPEFSWWLRLPYAHLDSTLANYATFLRDVVAPANLPSSLTPAPLAIPMALAPRYGEVPDLDQLLALPQDEMSDIVQRFRGGGAGAGRGGGGGGPARDSAFYNAWLAALNTLDFDRLSRNAQVDYLYIKRRAELERSRLGRPLPATNPRKTDNSGIPGLARGREGLIRDLEDELIPYTPEQLMVLAEREFAWHEEEMKKASREMGFGDDWKAAVEATKRMHVKPGEQPRMIRELVYEAIEFLRDRDLITMPEIAAEVQHMTMMSPERQLTSPFFLGGSQIIVSYPTDAMEFEARLQSMRGNNRPWSHATAQHEMIPGHNLTGYYGQRFGTYRPSLGGGPFFSEGWAVYWELTLWDKGFHDTPEERVGALVWRMHRCARIIFSLKFHLGEWSPQEAIDFLVERVGHEPDNATAEVRRSFEGSYGPLYQAAYLLGAIQLRGLRREFVDSGRMTEKAFHDEILRQGSMPIALLRLALPGERLTRDMRIDNWRFYGELPER